MKNVNTNNSRHKSKSENYENKITNSSLHIYSKNTKFSNTHTGNNCTSANTFTTL